MIDAVDESLRVLIREEVLNGAGVELSFDAPNREWSSRRNSPTLNLYLYDVREDLQRRSVQYVEKRNDEGFVASREMPPRKFKLSYLVTAWTQRTEDEHRLLSAVLSCFVRFDAIPVKFLRGGLADQPKPVRCTVALPLPPERALSDVWSALGGELKPSLDLVVTAPFVSSRYQPVGPPVTEEPFLRVRPADREPLEERARRRHPGEDAAPGDAAVAATETVDGGRTKAGRRIEIIAFPGSDRHPERSGG